MIHAKYFAFDLEDLKKIFKKCPPFCPICDHIGTSFEQI